MPELVRTARIVREHHRQPLLACRAVDKPVPGGHPLDDSAYAFVVRPVRQVRELQIGIALPRRLEADDTRKQPAVNLRQHHMHCQITRREPAKRFRPIIAPGCRQCDLEYRTGCGIERRRAVIGDRREGGRIDDHRRSALLEMPPHPIRHTSSLQRGDEYTIGIKTFLPQCCDQRVDRGSICRGEIGTIEDHQRARPLIRIWQRRDCTATRTVESDLGNFGFTDDRPRIETRRQCELGDCSLRRYCSALVAQRLQPSERRAGQCRECIQARIVATISRKHRKRDVALFGQLMQGGQSVWPVGFAADQAHQHAPRLRQRTLDIGVDR